MNFKEFFDSDFNITDRWPVNKAMYDMDDPAQRKQYEDDLKERLASMRSFKRDAEEVGDRLFLSGDKAMNSMLWFNYDIQPVHHYDPKEYAIDHAYGDGYLLTYPLKCTRSYRVLKYNDGSEAIEPPKDTKTNTTELDNRTIIDWRLYELPPGWFFTWQVEKNMGFKGKLEVDWSMLKRVQ